MSAQKPRALVLGAAGMLGHKLVQTLNTRMSVVAGVRKVTPALAAARLPAERFVTFDAQNPESIRAAVAEAKADVLINAVGLIKQSPLASDSVTMVAVNALFPHLLARAAAETNARLIHLSTDCVFSGARGRYAETDTPDATDLYGRSKLVGEVGDDHSLTIRTSMIGRELQGGLALVEWFLAAPSPVRGFRHAIFSGLTTNELSSLISRIILEFPELRGMYQVAAEPIDKLSLLTLVRDARGLRKEIVPDDTVRIDRSLDGSRFRSATGYVAPAWPAMIDEMLNDPTPYDEIHAATRAANALETA